VKIRAMRNTAGQLSASSDEFNAKVKAKAQAKAQRDIF
jgi:hypothetical protein